MPTRSAAALALLATRSSSAVRLASGGTTIGAGHTRNAARDAGRYSRGSRRTATTRTPSAPTRAMTAQVCCRSSMAVG
jgi:hypothetical protein